MKYFVKMLCRNEIIDKVKGKSIRHHTSYRLLCNKSFNKASSRRMEKLTTQLDMFHFQIIYNDSSKGAHLLFTQVIYWQTGGKHTNRLFKTIQILQSLYCIYGSTQSSVNIKGNNSRNNNNLCGFRTGNHFFFFFSVVSFNYIEIYGSSEVISRSGR